MKPDNSFKPKPLRYDKGMAEIACHAFASTTRFGLTQVLGFKSMSTPTDDIRMALGRVEFRAYAKYILHCYPQVTLLEKCEGSEFALTDGSRVFFRFSGCDPSEANFIPAFRGLVDELTKSGQFGWYERVLEEARARLPAHLGLPKDAVLQAFCESCKGVTDGLLEDEYPADIRGIANDEPSELEIAAEKAMRSIFDAPYPEPDNAAKWLQSGTYK